jgi:hypothetical protein
MALQDSTLQKWSDSKLAELCGVSHPFVGQIRGERVTVSGSPLENTRVSSDGASRPATQVDADMQRKKIVAAIVANEGASNRAIAELVGCDHKTVGSVRNRLRMPKSFFRQYHEGLSRSRLFWPNLIAQANCG